MYNNQLLRQYEPAILQWPSSSNIGTSRKCKYLIEIIFKASVLT